MCTHQDNCDADSEDKLHWVCYEHVVFRCIRLACVTECWLRMCRRLWDNSLTTSRPKPTVTLNTTAWQTCVFFSFTSSWRSQFVYSMRSNCILVWWTDWGLGQLHQLGQRCSDQPVDPWEIIWGPHHAPAQGKQWAFFKMWTFRDTYSSILLYNTATRPHRHVMASLPFEYLICRRG